MLFFIVAINGKTNQFFSCTSSYAFEDMCTSSLNEVAISVKFAKNTYFQYGVNHRHFTAKLINSYLFSGHQRKRRYSQA
jgi:hypothetical protein